MSLLHHWEDDDDPMEGMAMAISPSMKEDLKREWEKKNDDRPLIHPHIEKD